MTAETPDTGDTGPSRHVEQEIEVEASPERVWRALTEARELERWFPLEARVEPGEGGEIFMSWKNEFEGTSEILTWEPPTHLRVSWGAPAEGSGQVTDYHIEGGGGTTRLRVVTSGFPEDASWDDWVEGTRLGWLFELTSLKYYLERHEGEDRRVIYLRRRVDLSRREAWDRLFGPEGFDPEAPDRGTLHHEGPRQYTTETTAPARGLLRISTEPCGPGVDAVDVTVFHSAWGDSDGGTERLEREWRERLELLFPEGASL